MSKPPTANADLSCRFDLARLHITAIRPGALAMTVRVGTKMHTTGFDAQHRAEATFLLADLQEEVSLEHEVQLLLADGTSATLSVPLMTRVDIRTDAEFLDRVQSLRNRIKDPAAVRFCARRLLHRRPAASPALRAAALCAIGYRIAESLDQLDPDLPLFWREVGCLLAEVEGGEDLVRWTTSVTMCATYVAILLRNDVEAEALLRKTLSYRSFLPKLSLLHTNFSRSDILLALIRLARGDSHGAALLLKDVPDVARTGVAHSHIDNPMKGRSQFSEIFAVIKSLRIAHGIAQGLPQATNGEQMLRFALGISIGEVTNITRGLEAKGHWSRLLMRAAGRDGDEELPSPQRMTAPAPAAATPLSAKAEALWRAAVAALSAGGEAPRSDELADLDAELDANHRRGRFDWQAALELSRARLCLALLARVQNDENLAFDLAAEAGPRIKNLLSVGSLNASEDFDAAGLMVLCASSSFLFAHRFLRPLPPLLKDNLAGQEFIKTTNRVLQNPVLPKLLDELLQLHLSEDDIYAGLKSSSVGQLLKKKAKNESQVKGLN